MNHFYSTSALDKWCLFTIIAALCVNREVACRNVHREHCINKSNMILTMTRESLFVKSLLYMLER